MLPKGIVGAALRRGAEAVAAPRVGGEGGAVPLLDGIRRIGEYHIKLHQPVALHEFWLGQGVAALNAEIFNAVQKAVHPGNGGSHQVALLPVQADIAPFLALSAQLGNGGEQHAAGAASGVVDALAGLRLEHCCHQMDDGAVGVKLGGSVAGVVGKFLD